MLLLLLLGCPTSDPEPKTCDTLLDALSAEEEAIRSCTEDAECGQPLTGTSCGCTQNLVARTDADTTAFYALLDELQAAECDAGMESDCSCPEADGFVCDEGLCAWDYVGDERPLACDADDGAPYTVTAASVDGDTLTVAVTTSGGCGDHSFSLCWPDGSFMESEPVQVNLELLHETDDLCDGIEEHTAALDLVPLKEAWIEAYRSTTGTIVIHLGGQTVTYTF